MVTEEIEAAVPAASPFRARARALRLVLTDCDGVLTDGGLYYSDSGEAMRRFTVRDGMGVERLRDAGVETAILTREDSRTVSFRSAKLRLPFLYMGVRDKAAHLPAILREAGVALPEVAFIGDDVNDLPLLRLIGTAGLTGAPADAEPEVATAVHFHGRRAGGHGAFREFAEWLLALRAGANGDGE
jgi:3-deoxy-D-manno-octulosonate 8-phosphate phosphatase (KDO 8-P phosphatase)